VGQWADVFDRLDFESGSFQGGDGTFAATARAFDSDFDIFDAKLASLLGLLCGTLPRKRRALSAALEPGGPGTCPAERIALGVGDRDHRVVKSRDNVCDGDGHVSACAFLFGLRFRCFSHFLFLSAGFGCWLARYRLLISLVCYRKSLTPFFPATVFLGPLRVRALVLVRCPRTGKPRR